jgi:hypothetical protein
MLWSSEDPEYGGHGTPRVFTRKGVRLPAHAAVLLAPDAASRIERDPNVISGDKAPPEESESQ